MDQIVTLETTKLAMEVGFKENVTHLYLDGENNLLMIATAYTTPPYRVSMSDIETPPEELLEDGVPAPTQTALSRWLREKHGLFTMITLDDAFGYWYEIHSTPNTGNVELLCGCMESGNEYEDAMENALQAACRIVKERMENE